MNRTIKEAMVQRYRYDSHEQLKRHLASFVAAYPFFLTHHAHQSASCQVCHERAQKHRRHIGVSEAPR